MAIFASKPRSLIWPEFGEAGGISKGVLLQGWLGISGTSRSVVICFACGAWSDHHVLEWGSVLEGGGTSLCSCQPWWFRGYFKGEAGSLLNSHRTKLFFMNPPLFPFFSVVLFFLFSFCAGFNGDVQQDTSKESDLWAMHQSNHRGTGRGRQSAFCRLLTCACLC